MNKILTKDEILTFLQKKLLAIDNLSSFCNNHNLNYQILSAIKNGKTKKNYPNVMITLSNLFGYNLKYDCFYILQKNGGKNGKITKNKTKTDKHK